MKKKATVQKKRSAGQTQTSISLDVRILRAARELAQEQRRSFSKLVEKLLAEELSRKTNQSPSDQPEEEPDLDDPEP